MEQSLFGGMEQSINKTGFVSPVEKTHVEKLMAKEEMHKIEELISKNALSLEEMNRLAYLINSMEIKLVNFSDMTRYVCMKWTTWIHDAIDIYSTHLQNRELLIKKGDWSVNIQKNVEQTITNYHTATNHLLQVYMFAIRSSLSMSATAFDAFTKNRVEYEYGARTLEAMNPNQGNTIFNFKGKSQ